MKLIRLAHTDKKKVHSDVLSLFPDWNKGRHTIRYTKDNEQITYTDEQASGTPENGNVVHICPIGDRVLEPAQYDGETLTQDAVMAGETRIDIILPDWMELPELETLVEPANPDMTYV